MLVEKNKAQIMKDFGISANDTGSVQVQIALLTERLREVTEHTQKNPKDMAAKKGLLQIVATRRSFLEYLKKKNLEQYKEIVNRLGLRK
jgi:small subunit ribosomal protein S15